MQRLSYELAADMFQWWRSACAHVSGCQRGYCSLLKSGFKSSNCVCTVGHNVYFLVSENCALLPSDLLRRCIANIQLQIAVRPRPEALCKTGHEHDRAALSSRRPTLEYRAGYAANRAAPAVRTRALLRCGGGAAAGSATVKMHVLRGRRGTRPQAPSAPRLHVRDTVARRCSPKLAFCP